MQLEMMEMPTIWMTLVMLLFVTEVMASFVATIVCVTSWKWQNHTWWLQCDIVTHTIAAHQFLEYKCVIYSILIEFSGEG